MKYVLVLICVLAVTNVLAQGGKKSAKPFVLGLVDELYSSSLDENRVLNIYLPEGYDKNDSSSYPVVYLLDGSAEEDFIHVVGLYQFNSFPWIDQVPKSIIVGISNIDRKRDFTFPSSSEEDKLLLPTSGGSKEFRDFLTLELQPFIQQKYRGKQGGTLIGQSLGGLVVTEILLKSPEYFDRFIIISPSIWWDNGSILEYSTALLQDSDSKNIYIGTGKEGFSPGKIERLMEEDAQLLSERLKQIGNEKLDVFFDYMPDENHATVTHQAVFNALRIIHTGTK